MQEEHVLERWRASSSPMKGVCSVREKRKFLTRGKGVREWRGFLSYRGAQMNRTHRIFLSHRITQITRVRRFLLSHRFTQMNRTHSIPQRPCGRQISQNLTAIFSWNALWSLYAEGLLWARNCAQKCSVNSVRSVRERNTLCKRKESPLWEKNISFVRDITFKLVTLSICYHAAKPVYLLPCLLIS